MLSVIINKMDLLRHVDSDLAAFRHSVKGLNPEVEVFLLSCKTGEKTDEWCAWILRHVQANSAMQ